MPRNVRMVAAEAARAAAAFARHGASSRFWPPYTRLVPVGDASDWVLRKEAAELAATARRLGADVAMPAFHRFARRQSIFHFDQFRLVRDDWRRGANRVGFAYFHGVPGTSPALDDVYRAFERHHPRIDRVQTSHRRMRDVVLATGVDPQKVFLIPIAVDTSTFRPPTGAERDAARARLGLPASAFVVGSFQKDGVGWGAGLEPKLEKGPDVLLRVLELVKASVPELFVLLSGPARGYVAAGLRARRIPYRHVYVRRYPDIVELYHAIDGYVVTSREEGGPKAVLESLACGVPFVSTRVGQAEDLVEHGRNGWLADVGDADALAAHVAAVASGAATAVHRDAGVATARAHSYTAQAPLWRDLLHGFVALE